MTASWLYQMPDYTWLIIAGVIAAVTLVMFLVPKPIRRSRHHRKH